MINLHHTVRSAIAYCVAVVLIFLACLFLGWLYGLYLLVTSGVVWYAAKPKSS